VIFRLAQVSKRFSTVATGSNHTHHEKTFRDAFKMEPGTYPLMGLVVLAFTGAVCFTMKKTITDPDIQISSSKQSNPLRGEAAKEIDIKELPK
jgi:hypothetical protein